MIPGNLKTMKSVGFPGTLKVSDSNVFKKYTLSSSGRGLSANTNSILMGAPGASSISLASELQAHGKAISVSGVYFSFSQNYQMQIHVLTETFG